MTTTSKTPKAIDSYIAAHAKTLELMAALFEAVENQPCPLDDRPINWGHVGSLNHLNHLLDEALAFATNRED